MSGRRHPSSSRESGEGRWLTPQSHTTQLLTLPESSWRHTKSQSADSSGSPEGGAIAFPQANAARREVLHPRKMVSAVWERNSAQGSQRLSLQLSPQSHRPSNDSIQHCPPFTRAQEEWLQTRFCALAL